MIVVINIVKLVIKNHKLTTKDLLFRTELLYNANDNNAMNTQVMTVVLNYVEIVILMRLKLVMNA